MLLVTEGDFLFFSYRIDPNIKLYAGHSGEVFVFWFLGTQTTGNKGQLCVMGKGEIVKATTEHPVSL